MYISYVGLDKSKNNFALASQGEGVLLTVTGTDQCWFGQWQGTCLVSSHCGTPL